MADNHADLTDPDLHEPKGIAIAPANSVYVATGTGTGFWERLPNPDAETIGNKIGAVIYYAGSTAPSGWLLCGGQEVSRETYADLYNVIGNIYGNGDGLTTFNLPDLRGRLVAGRDDMGGAPANRLTEGITGSSLGSIGGTESVLLGLDDIPVINATVSTGGAHTHSVSYSSTPFRLGGGSSGFLAPGPIVTIGTTNRTLTSAGSHSHTVTLNPGGGQAHQNVQPVIVLNAIIYCGV
jgi:microcystin-dependent protein